VILFIAMAAGCISRTHMPTCEVLSETELNDDEQTFLGSAQDLLDQVLLDQEALGTWADGEQTQAQVQVSRGPGSAVLVEQFRTERVTEHRSVGRATDFYPAIGVMCFARLEVPVTLELSTQDGVLDLTVDGTSSLSEANPDREASYADASRGLGADELPVFDKDPADYESRQLQLGVSAVDGVLVSGEVGWSGLSENTSVSETVLELAGD
jgi:hypothetical protein